MGKNIYVGNLPYDTSGDELKQLFEAYGTVSSGQVIIDTVRRTQSWLRLRGNGSGRRSAKAAIDALNGTPYGGRPLTVNEARPREERATGSGRGWLRWWRRTGRLRRRCRRRGRWRLRPVLMEATGGAGGY